MSNKIILLNSSVYSRIDASDLLASELAVIRSEVSNSIVRSCTIIFKAETNSQDLQLNTTN